MSDQNLILALIRPVGFDNPDELVEASFKMNSEIPDRIHSEGEWVSIERANCKSFSTSKPLPDLKKEFEKLGRVAYLHEKEYYTYLTGNAKHSVMLGVFASEEEVRKVLEG